MRVSPPRVSSDASRANRPPAGSPGADAHRQTGFVLGVEVEILIEALNLEGQVVDHLSTAKFRKPEVAAVIAFHSRSWLTRLAALHLAEVGNYVASFPLLAASADFCAAVSAALGEAQAAWTAWATGGGISRAPAFHAVEYELHESGFGTGSPQNQALQDVRRLTTALTSPNFGATVLLTANASDTTRLAVTFGDRDFHLGMAELVFGFLAVLSREHLAALTAEPERFGLIDRVPAVPGSIRRIDELLARADRCRMAITEVSGQDRILVSGFRRSAGAAATRVLL